MKRKLLHFVSEQTILSLEEEHLGLSHLWILERVSNGDLISEELKKSSPYRTLERKEYILGNNLTEKGDRLIHHIWSSYSSGVESNLLFDPEVIKDSEVAEKERQFEEWWFRYPLTDRIKDISGKVIFPGKRNVRQGKDYCKRLYLSLLKEYKHEDLMAALNYEIDTRIKQSFDKRENILSFMQNSKTYLFNKSFEGFMMLAKETEKGESKPNTFHI